MGAPKTKFEKITHVLNWSISDKLEKGGGGDFDVYCQYLNMSSCIHFNLNDWVILSIDFMTQKWENEFVFHSRYSILTKTRQNDKMRGFGAYAKILESQFSEDL